MIKEVITSKHYALFVLLLISGFTHLAGTEVDAFGRNILSLWGVVIQLSAYILAGIGVLYSFKDSLNICKKNIYFMLFCALACISAFWSVDFSFSITRFTGAFGVILIALLLANRFSVADFLQWMFWFLICLSILNYLFLYFFPELSLTKAGNYSSMWKGLFVQKNQLAHVMVVFIVISYILFLTKKIHISLFAFSLILAMPLVFFAKSMTANVILFVGVFSALSIFLYYKYQFSLSLLLLLSLLLIISVFIFKSELLAFVGKSETLTGRTITWGVVYEQSKTMPFLGHGYGIWIDPDNVSNQYKGLIALGGHNGFLDVLFWFGWLGVAIFFVFIADVIRKLYILLKHYYDYSTILFLSVYFIMFMLENITESFILVRSGLFWVIFVYTTFKINEIFYNLDSTHT